MGRDAAESGNAPAAPVARRRVFFVSGFDPEGPRRYHDIYRREGARQAKIAGYDLTVGALAYEGREGARWEVEMRRDAGATATSVAMLRWDDVARARMRRPLWALYVLMAATVRRYVGSGAFAALCRVRAVSTWVGMYPVAMMLLYLAGALAAAALVLWIAALLGAPLFAGAPVAAIAAWLVLRATRRWDGATLVYYLMADFGFTADHAEGAAPEMEARIDAFAARIAAALDEPDVDETLLVGHSSGAAYAVSAAARALSRAAPSARLSLLTLGQTIPMLSFLPGAARLREELGAVAADPRIEWIDVSTPADGACYALADPVAVSGVAAAGPKVLSAKFWDALTEDARAAIKGRWFRIHIQYFFAFDDPAAFDYFAITAGPRRLGERFAERRPSPQRIERPLIQRRLRRV